MRGMKQIELATLSGISKYSISHYLKGDWEGKQDAVYELARVLDVSEAWLMGYDVPPERKTVAKGAPAIPPGFIPLPSTHCAVYRARPVAMTTATPLCASSRSACTAAWPGPGAP